MAASVAGHANKNVTEGCTNDALAHPFVNYANLIMKGLTIRRLVMISIEERFSAILHNAARSLRQALERRLKDLGVSQAGWMTIAAIAKAPMPLSQTVLADRLAIENPTMGSMLDRLMYAGLVHRQPSKTDRRVKLVSLTDNGERVYQKVKAEAGAFRSELLTGVDRDTLLAATELLERLHAASESSP